jgi:GxxExxY protein
VITAAAGAWESKKGRIEGVQVMLKTASRLSDAHEVIVSKCLDAAIAVHRELGPGFREIIYHRALLLELDSRGVAFETEKPIAVRYRDWVIPGQKADLVVEKIVLVEIKTVPKLKPVHRHQVTSYLKAADLKVGLLLNFSASLLKYGMQRVMI